MNADREPTITESKLIELLKEPTGRSILDSGDYYGRHWQRNANRDFLAEPPVELRFTAQRDGEEKRPEIEFTRTALSFCCEWLDYDPAWDAFYRLWGEWDQYKNDCAEEPDAFFNRTVDVDRFDQATGRRHQHHDHHWTAHLEDMRDFMHFLKVEGFVLSGIYGEGAPFTAYTYNEANVLDQDLQYLYFTVEGIPASFQEGFGLGKGTFVLLQVHGGCDARGGMSSPKAFEVEEESFLCPAQGSIACEHDHMWYTDDAYHWYSDDGGALRLEEYRALDLENLNDEEEKLCHEAEEYLAAREAAKPQPGQLALGLQVEERAAPAIETLAAYLAVKHGILTVSDGEGFCPICGAKLSGW